MPEAPTLITKRADELRPGDLIDLEGDKFVDPGANIPKFASQYQLLNAVDHETPKCVAVWIDGHDCVGFPPDHVLKTIAADPDDSDF